MLAGAGRVTLICLDLDGTLVPNTLEERDGKLQRLQSESFTRPLLLPGRREILEARAAAGDIFAIVTNQGGVAWGYHTQREVHERIGATLAQLDFFWGRPFSLHVAWKMEKGNLLPQFRGNDGRKPQPDMILAAIAAAIATRSAPAGQRVLGVSPVMVGDREEDHDAALNAGVDFLWANDFFEVPF